jgi:CubicO group peptidase (beta-lactamase class C family)
MVKSSSNYYPPTEVKGGWRTAKPESLSVDANELRKAVDYHSKSNFTSGYGGALLVVYKGHLIAESYSTGSKGGPQPWTPSTCNDIKSSTKSVFGTAVGVFLDEFKDKVSLDSYLVGSSREESLIPQIWEQPITDERKKKIKVKHVMSMTSGHESREPWLAPSARRHHQGYSGSFQMYEYCFGWWFFEGIPGHHTLKFEPGHGFTYSNFGLEQMALAMRNISGEKVGPYIYDRVLSKIGVDRGLRNNQYVDMPYTDSRELNFSAESGWGRGGSEGCNAYGADRSRSRIGFNTVVGSTFRCTARDFARVAYLWLRGGRWGDEQLVPEGWMEQATRRFLQETGEAARYGYTFWIQDDVDFLPKDTFMSRGHNMNHSVVIPSLDLVIVRQGNESRPGKEGARFVNTLIKLIVESIPI